MPQPRILTSTCHLLQLNTESEEVNPLSTEPQKGSTCCIPTNPTSRWGTSYVAGRKMGWYSHFKKSVASVDAGQISAGNLTRKTGKKNANSIVNTQAPKKP